MMLAGSWNLLDQSGHDVLVACQRRGIDVHNAGIFASGLLVGGDTVRYAPASREMVERARRWRQLCQKYGLKIQAVAIAFAFMPKVVKKIAVGVSTVAELEQNVSCLACKVPKQLWVDAKKEGLLLSKIVERNKRFYNGFFALA